MFKKYGHRVFCFIFLFALLFIFKAFLAAAPLKQVNLKFYLQLKDKAVKVGEPVSVSLALKNTGKQAFWINRRWLVNYASHPHEVYFMISGPEEELPFKLKIRAGLPQEQDFVLLEPLKELVFNFDLNSAYDLSQPGTYKVQAVYENGTSLPAKKVWQGKLFSNILNFNVTEPK
jgi:hypothetical protein